jgi:hypothetical protein
MDRPELRPHTSVTVLAAVLQAVASVSVSWERSRLLAGELGSPSSSAASACLDQRATPGSVRQRER